MVSLFHDPEVSPNELCGNRQVAPSAWFSRRAAARQSSDSVSAGKQTARDGSGREEKPASRQCKSDLPVGGD